MQADSIIRGHQVQVNMSDWDSYLASYRAMEVAEITDATSRGECVAVVGLSGAGKSNLLGFMAHRAGGSPVRYVLVDGNRLTEQTAEALLGLMERAIGGEGMAVTSATALERLETVVDGFLAQPEQAGRGLSFLMDLSRLAGPDGRLLGEAGGGLYGNLRALRDAFKYRLTYVTATRRPWASDNEIAELFFGRTLWLSPLAGADALWNVEHYAQRAGLAWDSTTRDRMVTVSGGYPALLRAVCEAAAAGASLDEAALAAHPAVARRVDEFWADAPTDDALAAAGVTAIGLLMRERPLRVDTARLTLKENQLLAYVSARAGEVCAKDEVIRGVWPEDRVFEQGVRDDSLAQLVRRLREKIEQDPGRPRHLHTVPGRGYRFTARPSE
jgi:hypothetical protein